MGRINFGRVVLGGLLAGVLINLSEFILNGIVYAEEMNAAMATLNKPPIDDSMIVWFVVLGFGLAAQAAAWAMAQRAAKASGLSRSRERPCRLSSCPR